MRSGDQATILAVLTNAFKEELVPLNKYLLKDKSIKQKETSKLAHFLKEKALKY